MATHFVPNEHDKSHQTFEKSSEAKLSPRFAKRESEKSSEQSEEKIIIDTCEQSLPIKKLKRGKGPSKKKK